VGLGVTFCFLPALWPTWLIGFALFRFFDIVKPWPIGWLDRQVKGGLGNVLDDVVAGVFSCLGLQVYFYFI
jgi:phosphatidylglycerophosphatase A